jgi:hypothetical protein
LSWREVDGDLKNFLNYSLLYRITFLTQFLYGRIWLGTLRGIRTLDSSCILPTGLQNVF